MIMEVYFDNSATTRTDENVVSIMNKVMLKDYGNPSSRHMKGMQAEDHVRNARSAIASVLKVNEKEIIFTSGGTESNNFAIIQAAMALRRSGRHIITTCFEHPSVTQPLKYLEKYNFPDRKSVV